MIQTSILSNGIRIVTESVPDAQTVSVQYSIEIGSQNDPTQYSGLAHLLEHALFLGSKLFSQKEIQRYDHLIGSTLNAETNQECTCISDDVLTEDLPKALELIADIIQNPLFPPQAVHLEKKVVLNEIEEVSQDDDMFADNLIYKAAYKNQALQHPTEGYEKTVRAITPDIIKNHYQIYRQPDKMIISLSGNVKHKQVVKICQSLFGQIQSSTKLKPLPKTIYTGGDKRIAEEMSSNVFRLGFNGIPFGEGVDGYIKASILATVLEQVLYDELRFQKGLLYSIHADNEAYKNCALFIISAACLPKNTKEVIQGSAQIIGQIEKYITLQNLQAAQKSIKLDLSLRTNSPHEKAISNEFDMRYFNRIIPLKEYFQKIEAVCVADIKEMAKRIFSSRLSFAGVGKLKEMPSYEQITQWIEKAHRQPTQKYIAKQIIQNHLSKENER